MEQQQFIERAHLLHQQKRYSDAIKQAGLALQQDPEDDEALIIIAHCKIDLQQYDDALLILQQCIHLNPENDYAFYLMAFAYYQKDLYDKAMQFLNDAIAQFPYNAGYFSLKGNIYLVKGKFKEALAAAEEGLAIDAEDTGCLNCRSKALFKLKRKEEAIETIQEALAVDPEDYQTHANYGWHFLEKGNHNQAIIHFKESLRNNPNYEYAKEGFKASLKANLVIYRWLLQYSLWMQNQTRAMRLGVLFGLFILVRLALAFGKPANNVVVALIVGLIVLAYLLFILLSWLGDALANLYILWKHNGRLFLSVTEKWQALVIGTCLTACVVFFVLSLLVKGTLFIGCLASLGISLLFTEMEFPIKLFKGGSRNNIAQIVLLCVFLSCICLFFSTQLAMFFAIVAFIFFVGFMWSSPFKH